MNHTQFLFPWAFPSIIAAPCRAQIWFDPLSREVVDICEVLGWRQMHINSENIEGIVVSPEDCEPLILCFQQEGKLASPFSADFNSDSSFVSTKTHSAGMDTHMTIIRLLHYLNYKYFSFFELIDEGKFWETGDEEQLRVIWRKYDAAIDAVGSLQREFKAGEGETKSTYMERLEAFLRDRITGPSNNN